MYGAFFICFTTRAVHLGVVSDLTAENFIELLHRFVFRRGLPASIFSNNGKNFVGAHNLLYQHRNQILKWAADQHIKWQFIVSLLPHQGGLWEAAVKSTKSLLERATLNQTLTFESLITIFFRVEAILNSRPLRYRSVSNKITETITPGHFLIRQHLMSIPIDDNKYPGLGKKLDITQSIIRSFWRQWSKSYLNELQKRNKWRESQPNFRVRDEVILKEDGTSVMEWPLGIITNVYPDKDGLECNVQVKAKNNLYTRNVTKLVTFASE